MIRLEHLSIEKQPKDYDADGKVKTWQWVVMVGGQSLAACDADVEAEEFVGTVRLRTAVLNNFTFKRRT